MPDHPAPSDTRPPARPPGLWRRLFGPRRPVVPVLRLSGTIGAASGPLRGGGLSIARTAGAIERAFKAKGAVAVAVVVNSPGGTPAQAHLIMRRIRALADEKSLPVLAFVEDVAASGGYMIACAADEIVADPSSVVGSIGVVSASFGFDRLIDRLGIDRRVHTAGRSKAILDPFRPENPEDIERLAALQADIHAMFIDLVKERRGARLRESDDLFSGAFWTARPALALGLVDAIGDLRSTLRGRFGEKVRLRPVPVERGFLARRLGATQVDAGALGSGLIEALETRALWARFGL